LSQPPHFSAFTPAAIFFATCASSLSFAFFASDYTSEYYYRYAASRQLSFRAWLMPQYAARGCQALSPPAFELTLSPAAADDTPTPPLPMITGHYAIGFRRFALRIY
jgi:hypothetical protein